VQEDDPSISATASCPRSHAPYSPFGPNASRCSMKPARWRAIHSASVTPSAGELAVRMHDYPPFHILLIRSFLPLLGIAVGKTGIVHGVTYRRSPMIFITSWLPSRPRPGRLLAPLLSRAPSSSHDLARLGARSSRSRLDERCFTGRPMVLLVCKTGAPEMATKSSKSLWTSAMATTDSRDSAGALLVPPTRAPPTLDQETEIQARWEDHRPEGGPFSCLL